MNYFGFTVSTYLSLMYIVIAPREIRTTAPRRCCCTDCYAEQVIPSVEQTKQSNESEQGRGLFSFYSYPKSRAKRRLSELMN